MMPGVDKRELTAAAQAAEFAANAETIEQEMVAMTHLMRHEAAIKLAMTAQRMSRFGGPPTDHERLPLMDEDGYDYGRVVARIPEDLFYALEFQKDFGKEAIHTKEGIDDICKAFPVCRTKTVSGKTQIFMDSRHVGGVSRARKASARFAPGTIQLAN